MSKARWIIAGVQLAASVCVLSTAVGCGGEPAAGTDPGARAQTEADAKSAMQAASQQQKPGKGAKGAKR